jgi:rSAM/selenodomain-associated transferase 1
MEITRISCGRIAMQALAVMAKTPIPGSVKTRLTPPLTPEEASCLYSRFLRDTLELACRVDGVERFIAYTPGEAVSYFRNIAPNGFGLIPQSGGDLGERLIRVAETLFDRGFDKVLLLGSDLPTLPPALIMRALAELETVDVVLGPCEDGGYYLIGLGRFMPELFIGIPWSTDLVIRLTLAKALAIGASVSLLASWYDVDTVENLLRLQRELQHPDSRKAAPHTYQAMRELGLLAEAPSQVF